MPTVAILAGGRGSRLGTLTDDTPKPLIRVGGVPFVRHQLAWLSMSGVTSVVMCVGYRGVMFAETLGDRCDGVDLSYSFDPKEDAGTAAALVHALPLLGSTFIVTYGDSLFPIDYRELVEVHVNTKSSATMAIVPGHDPRVGNNVIYSDRRVHAYALEPSGSRFQWVDGGATVLSASALRHEDSDLRVVFRRLAEEGDLAGYLTAIRFLEIGTPESLSATAALISQRPPYAWRASRA